MATFDDLTWDAAAAIGAARRHAHDNPELEREQKIECLLAAREYLNQAINQLTEQRSNVTKS